MSFGLAIGILGMLLFWGGYYGGMLVAWRAGVRNGALYAVAAVMGICGCFGLPLLAFFWSEVQKRTFALVEAQPDDAPPPPHMNRYRILAAVAAVGLVLQILGGNLIPDDDGEDWSDDEPSYTYDPVEDYAPPEEPPEDEDPTRDELDEAWEHWEDHVGGDEADAVDDATEEVAIEADEAAEADEAEEAAPVTVRADFLGAFAGRRVAVLLTGEQVRYARRARGTWPVSLLPCTPVSLEGEWDDAETLVVANTAELDERGCRSLPRPEVVRSFDAPLAEHAGRYVLLPAPHAETPTRLRFTDELTLTVRAPRGAIARDADYTAVRGVLVDASAATGRGGLELWVLRADDVVPL